MKRPTVVVVEHAPHGRAIPKHDRARLVLATCFATHRHTHGVQHAVRWNATHLASCTGLRRSRFEAVGKRCRVCLERFGWRGRLKGSAVPATLQHTAFDGASPSHFPTHLDLCTTVQLQHRRGHITPKVVLTIAVGRVRKLRGNRLHERLLFV